MDNASMINANLLDSVMINIAHEEANSSVGNFPGSPREVLSFLLDNHDELERLYPLIIARYRRAERREPSLSVGSVPAPLTAPPKTPPSAKRRGLLPWTRS